MRLAQRATSRPIATWPKWARQLALAPLLDKQGFTLTTFLLGNRVPPMVTMLRDYSASMLDKYHRGDIHSSVKY